MENRTWCSRYDGRGPNIRTLKSEERVLHTRSRRLTSPCNKSASCESFYLVRAYQIVIGLTVTETEA